MDLKIINSEHFIVSIDSELIPDNLRNHVLVFYWPERDAIVLNEGEWTSLLSEFVSVYLSATDQGRKDNMEALTDSKADQMLLGTMQTLNRIVRIRKKLCKSRLRRKPDEIDCLGYCTGKEPRKCATRCV
ncbi:MAG: hypothetical protein ACI4EY_10165 [Lachnospiraceae bacterium]